MTTRDPAGAVVDPVPRLYEHAFVLLALAAMRRAAPEDVGVAREAALLRDRLAGFRHPAGGFREAGDEPFQANAQMHLFEAALAWEAESGEPAWSALADALAELALTRFIDPADGSLGEVFDADWRRVRGPSGRIEPGHQFEWAWLLRRWSAKRGEARAEAAAQRLFEVGRRGFDRRRGTVADTLADDLSIRDAAARLWPQTEHLKASLILDHPACALQAAGTLAGYLDTPVRGVWREHMRADGAFIEAPSPATSLYHLSLAIRELRRR